MTQKAQQNSGDNTQDSTSNHFGFRPVNHDAKAGMVREVFSSVATRYDLMNDLMSGGMHRLWKNDFVSRINMPATAAILDLAGGTGDIAVRLKKRTGANVTVCDINEAMLNVGRDRQIDAAQSHGLRWVCGNAEHLPVPDNSLDVITIAFGLRNVTDIPQALRDAHRALKPGGQFLCLEFSEVVIPTLAKLYDKYSFKLIPKIGELVTKDRDSYQYLVESIRMFPKQEKLKAMMEVEGFARVTFDNLSMGIVAIHRGWKI
ncbi:MAG: bifunctional demethylmenaquinone methyltransferase/2-methoxy-6-polyprenyl-1,4-benzoquinol methylase UbiE [Rickettsiales bacterium]|nr:bifunctional demethylmenaquinone methyltransferase/2-methoxy-6-polyprenyl-1,4-benzoquinol methylase UbiE [Rickettsiales bacterium]